MSEQEKKVNDQPQNDPQNGKPSQVLTPKGDEALKEYKKLTENIPIT